MGMSSVSHGHTENGALRLTDDETLQAEKTRAEANLTQCYVQF